MIKKLKEKRGEGYIDICVGIIAFVMVLVVTINVFHFISIRVQLDQIAEDLITAATYSGEFGDDFNNADTYCLGYFDWYDLDWGADRYFNSTYERVQLGNRMWVKVSYDTTVQGLGIFSIPVTVQVTKSGLSERYWK